MKKILVPTDFSDYAAAAANYAIAVAKRTNAKVYFEHTMLVAVDWKNMSEEDKLLYPELKAAIEDAQNKLEEWENWVKDQGMEAESHLAFNEGLIDIPGNIRSYGYELVIMGSHGISNYEDYIMGSNAQRMVRFAPCPVLVIKEKQENPVLENIAFASDFEDESLPAFKKITDFAQQIGANIDLLYINTPVHFESTEKSLEKLEKFRKQAPDLVNKLEIFNHYTEEDGIIGYADTNKPDIVALATHGRSGWSQVFSSSITEDLIGKSRFPVLSVNLKQIQ